MTNGRDIGQSLKLIRGSDVAIDGLVRKVAQSQRDILVDIVDRAGRYDSQEAVAAARTAPLEPHEIQDAKERLLSGSPWRQYRSEQDLRLDNKQRQSSRRRQ